MKECRMRGVMGRGCREDPGENIESCVLWQTIEREYPEGDLSRLAKRDVRRLRASIRPIVEGAVGCPFQQENLKYLEKKMQGNL